MEILDRHANLWAVPKSGWILEIKNTKVLNVVNIVTWKCCSSWNMLTKYQSYIMQQKQTFQVTSFPYAGSRVQSHSKILQRRLNTRCCRRFWVVSEPPGIYPVAGWFNRKVLKFNQQQLTCRECLVLLFGQNNPRCLYFRKSINQQNWEEIARLKSHAYTTQSEIQPLFTSFLWPTPNQNHPKFSICPCVLPCGSRLVFTVSNQPQYIRQPETGER